MDWLLISILQNTGSEIIVLLLAPPIHPSLPTSAASAQCRTESTHYFRGANFSLTLGARCGGVICWSLLQHWRVEAAFLYLGENTLKGIVKSLLR